MAIRIIPFTGDHVAAVKALNARLRDGGSRYAFPEHPVPAWLPPGPLPYQEYRIAVDGDAARGAYILKHELFSLAGVEAEIGCFQLPISEGSVDRRYATVALRLVQDALRVQSRLHTLGMGSREEPVARLLNAVGWEITPVPFYFRVVHGSAFLRHLEYARGSLLRRAVLDALAITGIGHAGFRALHRLKRRAHPVREESEVKRTDRFEDWADAIWECNVPRLKCAAVRNARVLNRLYGSESERFIILTLSDGTRVRGWAVLLATQLKSHRHFGAMQLGSIVDVLCDPGFEHDLMAGATRELEHAGVDLIVTNQSWRVFGDALAREGYLQASTNFFWAVSPALATTLSPFEASVRDSHLTRGDGDGPINL